MILDCLSFKIDNQTFAIPTSIVLNIIEKPTVSVGIGNDGLLSSFIKIDELRIPIINLSRFISFKNTTTIKNGFFALVETVIDKRIEIVALHIDSFPQNEEYEEYQTFPFPKNNESFPCFIADCIVYDKGIEVIILDIDKIFNKSIITKVNEMHYQKNA